MLQAQYRWTVAAMNQKFQKQVLSRNEILLQKEPILTSDPQTEVFGLLGKTQGKLPN